MIALRRRTLRAADLALKLVLAGALAIFVLLALLPRTGLYRAETVLSGSMRPDFNPGDMVIVTPEPSRDVRVGQVISYRIPVGDHHVQTHRIVKIVRAGDHPVIRTKGDANNVRDPWNARLDGGTAWQVRAVVPKLGWMIVWLRDPLLKLLTVFVAPALFAAVALWRIWSDDDEGETAEEKRDVPRQVAPLS